MRITIILVFILAIPAVAFSATIIVPDDHATIQAAIDAASNKDLVLVKPGLYVENIDFKGKAITVRSDVDGDPATMDISAATTIIDGSQGPYPSRVVVFGSGEGFNTVLMGFTVRNGNSGGIVCGYNTGPLITDNIITGNANTYNSGGGIACGRCFATIKNNIITNNSTNSNGGGIYCSWAPCNPLITNNTVQNNTALNGGGIYCDYKTSPTIKENSIIDNISQDGTGGIVINGASPTISGNLISGNSNEGISSMGGGKETIEYNTIAGHSIAGIHCSGSMSLIENNTIQYNTKGIICTDASPEIKGNTISENQCGIFCLFVKNVTITGNVISFNTPMGGIYSDCGGDLITIDGNIISDNFGSGIRFSGAYKVDTNITNNLIRGNESDKGGAGICIYCESILNAAITNNIIFGNKSINSAGGGIYFLSWLDSVLEITNNTICRNESTKGCPGIVGSQLRDTWVKITNTIVWDNISPDKYEIMVAGEATPSSKLTISYCDVKGGKSGVYVNPLVVLEWGPGMIDADPQFVDLDNGDCHLTYTSLCSDTGTNAAPGLTEFDFEGDPRIVLGKVDMGADEFHRHLYWTGDATPGGDVALNFVGFPGAAPTYLWLGAGELDPPLTTKYGDWYLNKVLVAIPNMGAIPPSGVLVFPFTLPPDTPVPLSLFFQAGIDGKLSNLSVIDVM